MQALEKIALETNWIPVVLLLLFVIISFLKAKDTEKLKGYVFALFNKGFVEDEVEENTSFFSFFYGLLFVFSSTVLALVICFLTATIIDGFYLNISSFLSVLVLVFSYFILKNLSQAALTRLFLIKKEVRFYVVSKFSYFFSISFFLLIFFILTKFGPLEPTFLLYITIGLFLVRFIFHIRNNKNLIFSELFYFILYICAFEIAPLFILFKLIL